MPKLNIWLMQLVNCYLVWIMYFQMHLAYMLFSLTSRNWLLMFEVILSKSSSELICCVLAGWLQIMPEKCRYVVLSTKIEIRLAKAESINWTSLEFTKDNAVPQKLNVSSGDSWFFYLFFLNHIPHNLDSGCMALDAWPCTYLSTVPSSLCPLHLHVE